MLKRLLVAATAVALIAAPVASAYAQAAATAEKPKAEKKAAKPLTPQQQKMKDCAGKWKEEKSAKNVSGRTAYNKFMSGCLKGTA